MFCPRCGRPVNENANFCGGCGLPKAEIDKYIVKPQQPQTVQAEIVSEGGSQTDYSQNSSENAQSENASQPESQSTAFNGAQTESTECQSSSDTQNSYGTDSQSYSYTQDTSSSYDSQSSSYTSYDSQNQYSQAEYTPVSENKEQTPPTTLDFLWVMVISCIPIVGFIYLIYLAVQNDNIYKRSYARASFILMLFGVIISMIFSVGFILPMLFR